jgi:hypothetical protein
MLRYKLRTLLIVLALAGYREATPVAVAQQPPTAIRQEKQCRLVGPSIKHTFGHTVCRIENIDQLSAMTNVSVTGSVNSEWAISRGTAPITADNLPAIMKAATPVAPDSELFDMWHYGPYYSATFECGNRKWSVSLLLGGLGFLRDDEGRAGPFMYKMISSPKSTDKRP